MAYDRQNQVYTEVFKTEAEASAFQQGAEYFDDEHTSVDAPEPAEAGSDGEWVVRLRRFA